MSSEFGSIWDVIRNDPRRSDPTPYSTPHRAEPQENDIHDPSKVFSNSLKNVVKKHHSESFVDDFDVIEVQERDLNGENVCSKKSPKRRVFGLKSPSKSNFNGRDTKAPIHSVSNPVLCNKSPEKHTNNTKTDTKSPIKLARNLYQMIQDTVFNKKLNEPQKCPLVKQESDFGSSASDDLITTNRLANLIDFFFTIVKSQKSEDNRKSSGGSCFKPEQSPEDDYENIAKEPFDKDIEEKMDTLLEFLATTGCVQREDIDTKQDTRKISLMDFLLAKDLNQPNNDKTITESSVKVANLSYIDDTPSDERKVSLVEILIKYIDDFSDNDDDFKNQSVSVTPSLSEKSKSDVTLSRLETLSDKSRTKSDSSLTRSQDTVIYKSNETYNCNERRISESNIDFSHVKEDLDTIFNDAIDKIYELSNSEEELVKNDVMSKAEDVANYKTYTNPLQYNPCSFELSDILEEDETSPVESTYIETFKPISRITARYYAEAFIRDLVRDINDFFSTESSDDSEDEEEEEIVELRRASISLVDLRDIPDLISTAIIKPQTERVDKATTTDDLYDMFFESISDLAGPSGFEKFTSNIDGEKSIFDSCKSNSCQSQSTIDGIDHKSAKLGGSKCNFYRSQSTFGSGRRNFDDSKSTFDKLDSKFSSESDIASNRNTFLSHSTIAGSSSIFDPNLVVSSSESEISRTDSENLTRSPKI